MIQLTPDSKILVTGASGVLGKQLVYELNKRGIRPIVQVRKTSDSSYVDSLGLEKRIVDFKSDTDLSELVKDIDYIFHCAAIVNFRQGNLTRFTAINSMSPAKLYKAAQKAGVKRFCHISTAAAIGAIKRDAVNNKDSIDYQCRECCEFNISHLRIPYIMTKHAAETELFKLTENSPTALVLVNPSIILAPSKSGDDYKKARKMFQRFLIPEVPVKMNFVDIRDAVPGIITALEKGNHKERYIIAGDNISAKDFVLGVSVILGRIPHLVRFPRWIYNLTAQIAEKYCRFVGRRNIHYYPDVVKMLDYDWVYSSSKAYQELRYRWRSIHTTLDDLLNNNFNGTWLKP